MGSSPRMRGKRDRVLTEDIQNGLIPAHAGKTLSLWLFDAASTAHPRACGENAITAFTKDHPHGSSPRMRGKQCLRVPSCHLARLIPAHAGKTPPGRRHLLDRPAHPRACGENVLAAVGSESLLGSSPRMRGKPVGQGCSATRRGLIPAHAGKTLNDLEF